MFLGEYRHSVDAKGRVSLPARFRSEMQGSLVLARGFDGELRVYQKDEYAQFMEQIADMPQFKGRVRELSRWFSVNAANVDLDKSGRINIPSGFAEWAGIADEAVVTGSMDHVEIWGPGKWAEYQEKSRDIADLAEEIADLGVF